MIEHAAYLATLPAQAGLAVAGFRAMHREANRSADEQDNARSLGWESIERHPVLRKEQFAKFDSQAERAKS